MIRRPQRCERVREWVCLELDGEVSRFESRLVAAHVAACDDCATFRAEAVAFTEALREAPHEPLLHPVAIRLRRRPVLRTAQMAVAALAVAAVGVGALTSSLGQAPERTGFLQRTGNTRVDDNNGVDALRLRQLHQLAERLDVNRPGASEPGRQIA